MPLQAEDRAERRVTKLRKLIAGPQDERDEDISAEDRDALVKFDAQLVEDRQSHNRCGWKHHQNLLECLYDLATETDSLAASLEDGSRGRQAKTNLTGWVLSNYENGYTRQKYLSAIRVFARTVLDCEQLPKRFAEIEPGEYVDEDPSPLPSNIVEYPDVLDMIRMVDSVRDKALIITQWDVGPRPMEEMYPLQYKSVEINEDHIIITLPRTSGKTDRRNLIVTAGFPLLKLWIEEMHPVHDDPETSLGPDTYIWTKQNKNELLSYDGFRKRFDIAGKRAELDKDHSAQHLRRSSASTMARQPSIGERDLREHFDWSPFSDAPEHYISQHSEGVLTNVAMARGHDVANVEKDESVAPIPCDRCGEWTTVGLEECVQCSYNLDPEQGKFEKQRKQIGHPREEEKPIEQKILDGDVTASDLESVQKVAPDIMAKGMDFFENLPEWIKKSRAMERTQSGSSSDSKVPAFSNPSALAAWGAGSVCAAGERIVEAWHKAMKLSPEFEYYPINRMPRRRQAAFAGVMVGWFAVVASVMVVTGDLQAIMNGDWTTIVGFTLAVLLGLVMVHYEIPTVEEAAEARAEQA